MRPLFLILIFSGISVLSLPFARKPTPAAPSSQPQAALAAGERRGDTVERLIERVLSIAGDQDAALCALGLTERAHGLYGAQTPEMRVRRESFLHELLAGLTVYP